MLITSCYYCINYFLLQIAYHLRSSCHLLLQTLEKYCFRLRGERFTHAPIIIYLSLGELCTQCMFTNLERTIISIHSCNIHCECQSLGLAHLRNLSYCTIMAPIVQLQHSSLIQSSLSPLPLSPPSITPHLSPPSYHSSAVSLKICLHRS